MTDTTDAAGSDAADAADLRLDDADELATAQAVLAHGRLAGRRPRRRAHPRRRGPLPAPPHGARRTVRHGPGHRQAGPRAQAIRTVVWAAAVRDGTDVEVEFEDSSVAGRGL